MDFIIYTTKQCNLHCKYCCELHFMDINRGEKNELNLRKTSRFIMENSKRKQNNVIFYGGEPLLNQKWIRDFIKLTGKKNLSYSLQTNGTLLHKIDPYILKNIDNIVLSIDGNKKLTDRYRGKGVYVKIIKNINFIKNNFKGKLFTRMTYIPGNPLYEPVKHLIEKNLFDNYFWQIENSSASFDFQKTSIFYKREIGKLVDFWIGQLKQGKFIDIIPFSSITYSIITNKKTKSYRCGAGTSLVAIDTDGKCYACDEILEQEWEIGSIDGSLHKKKLKSKNFSKYCSRCEIYWICGGRCFKTALKCSDEKFRFYCRMTKILVREIKNRITEINLLLKQNQISRKELNKDSFSFMEIIP